MFVAVKGLGVEPHQYVPSSRNVQVTTYILPPLMLIGPASAGDERSMVLNNKDPAMVEKSFDFTVVAPLLVYIVYFLN